MKAEYVELTVEDQRIWRRVCCYGFHLPANHRGRDVCAEYQARRSDHFDGDLMLHLMRSDIEMRADGEIDVAKVKRGTVLTVAQDGWK